MKPWISGLLMVGVVAGCTAKVNRPPLGRLYDRAAMHEDPLRHPVIVIPGILGSRLIDKTSGRVVWGAFSGDYANPQTPEGARLVAHPMGLGRRLVDLRDPIEPDGALDRIKLSLFGLPVELNAYANILAALGVGGYRDLMLGQANAVDYGPQHYTCFQFAYDWRRDNVENARQLHEFIAKTRQYVQSEIEKRYNVQNPQVRFDIVAHSMGGLITRYYLRYGNADVPADGSPAPITWAGAKHVRKAILVGTPNLGSIKALLQLVNGTELAPVLPTYEPAVLGTMPSIYQLLPRQRHLAGPLTDSGTGQAAAMSLFEPDDWRALGWGLASGEQEDVLTQLLPQVHDSARRRAIALEHQKKCLARAKAFQAALDKPAAPPDGTSLHLFAGDAIDTPASALFNHKSGHMEITSWAPGDGTVLRASALGDERTTSDWQPTLRSAIDFSSVHFLFKDHLGLTKSSEFTDNVLYLLLEDPR